MDSIANTPDGSGSGGTIPSPFTEAEDTSPFSGDTTLGELLATLSACVGTMYVYLDRRPRLRATEG